MQSKIFITGNQKEYALLDSGDGMKLERYGSVTIARPDPQALWRKRLPESEWKKVDAHFTKTSLPVNSVANAKNSADEKGKWVITRPGLAPSWPISFGDLKLNIELTPFKHTGLFPEQLNNWKWCRELIEKAGASSTAAISSKRSAPIKVLNLFGYTGGATLSAVLAGAEVTHVDASKAALTWANENAKLSGLAEKSIRWILEDAAAFVKRELRRGSTYDAIIMDPPSFGRGTKGEIWKIEEDLLPFIEDCFKLLSDKPLFFVVNGYAAGYSSIAYENNLQVLVQRFGGDVESGELAIQEASTDAKNSSNSESRLLPCGIVSRWKRSL